jgi:flagellar export protein FliJ
MKRFHFRLERLLRLKQQNELQAELRQRHARGVWEAAGREVDSLVDRVAQSAAALESRIGRPVEAAFWVAQSQHMAQLRWALDGAEANAKRAESALDEANRLRQAAAADVESLRFLRKQQWQRHRAESNRAEQQRLDELWLSRRTVAVFDADQSGSGVEVMGR